MSKISVILPVYNVEPYLERCLRSILDNSHRDLEVICVDDGSKYGSGAILDRFAALDARVTVIHKENGGVSTARNRGLDAATGEFLAFIDPDDWIHPQYFEILLHFQRKENCQLVICGFSRPDEVEPYIRYEADGLAADVLDLEGIYSEYDTKVFIWGRLYRADLIQGWRFPEDVRTCEDTTFNAMVFGNCPDIRACYVRTPLYFYYIRPDSLASGIENTYELKLAKLLYPCAMALEDPYARRILLLETLKRCAASRYELSFQPDTREAVKECTEWIRRIVKDLCAMETVSAAEKVKYFILSLHPQTYRVYFLLKNPGALAEEKALKQKYAGK